MCRYSCVHELGYHIKYDPLHCVIYPPVQCGTGLTGEKVSEVGLEESAGLQEEAVFVSPGTRFPLRSGDTLSQDHNQVMFAVLYFAWQRIRCAGPIYEQVSCRCYNRHFAMQADCAWVAHVT